jgi:hypothetical protein
MARETISEKGRRLANAGKVSPDDHAAVYYVQGDTGTHTVVVSGAGHPFCSCPAAGHCSHIEAVGRSRVREAQSA